MELVQQQEPGGAKCRDGRLGQRAEEGGLGWEGRPHRCLGEGRRGGEAEQGRPPEVLQLGCRVQEVDTAG